MDAELRKLEPKLAKVIQAIFDAVSDVSVALRTAGTDETGSQNAFGDQQLSADLLPDDLIFTRLRECGAVETASSEEQSDLISLGGNGYSVAFDPLDGSSIVGANFAVGSIFGIWPGCTLVGQRGRDQSAACYSIYGPRTILVLARRVEGVARVSEFTLAPSGQWVLGRESISIGEKKLFAPANLRAAVDNPEYRAQVDDWMGSKYTLRYTGGFVPDVHQILAKGGGVFCNPRSASAPAKLRLLFEVAPLAYVVEAAGGASSSGQGSVLDLVVTSTGVRTVVALGSAEEVAKCAAALQV